MAYAVQNSNTLPMLDQYKELEDKKIKMLEGILEELKSIRKDTEVMKEAILFQPGGPGAEAAKEHFHSNL